MVRRICATCFYTETSSLKEPCQTCAKDPSAYRYWVTPEEGAEHVEDIRLESKSW